MRLAKIKNKYMYKTTPNDNGTHYYLVYFDRKEKKYFAIQLTHLYIKDKNRFRQVDNGFIKIEKFKEFDVPSGVRKKLYSFNSEGKNINLNDKANVVKLFKRNLSKNQSERIINFIKK